MKYFLKISFYFFLLLIICNFQKCEVVNSKPSINEKYNGNKNLISGISIEAPANPIDSSCFVNMEKIAAKWVAIIPFAFSRQGLSSVQYNASRQWWGEREEGIVACIQMAHQQKMKVMLKPQVWVGGGVYSGHFKCENDSAWKEWEHNYLKYILHNAQIAKNTGADLFCIGTEMDEAVKQRPVFWSNLIDSVKKIYKGDLTYAANWGCFKEFSSWEKLTYIGIDAYFPLSNAVTPSVSELLVGWEPHFSDIKQFTTLKNRPVLFTEYGYRSMDKCAEQPWLSYSDNAVNLKAQENAYEALYKKFIPQPWFAGGFLWKWHVNNEKAGGNLNSSYTPQNKPVEIIIKKWHNYNG